MVCLQALGLDVRLERVGPAPWGFQLMGGAECNLPLTVVKVQPGTPASRAGLADGDEVLRVNGVAAEGLTRARAHHIITSAPLRIELAVIRTIGAPPPTAPSPFEPEVPVTDRTESPFTPRPSTPYRPFSTEPIQEIPPLERPIILSPFYHDNFSKLKKLDFEPPTKFKLEVNKSYVPEEIPGEDVSQSYSAMGMEHVTSLDELRSEMDLQLMEDTAEFMVDAKVGEQRSEFERIVTDETKVTEKFHREEKIAEVMLNGNVTASLLTQLLDQAADEISKKTNETENKSGSIESDSIASTVSKDISRQIAEQRLENIIGCRELEAKDQNTLNKIEHDILGSEFVKSNEDVDIIEESISAKEIIKNFNAIVEEQNKSKNVLVDHKKNQSRKGETINFSENRVDSKNNKSRKKEAFNLSENRNTQSKKEIIIENQRTEEATNSFNEIKQHTISTANLLAEQRAYTLGLQTIPNIQGQVHSSYHYDLLLKTFFIHLTDVMVALSRIILAEGPSRSNSPMPTKKSEKGVSQNITQKTVNQTNITQERTHKEEFQSLREEKKMSHAKFAQLAQLKTEQMTQKMDAVISEFKKDMTEETNNNIEISSDARVQITDKIEEDKEDPLEWLEKVNELKTTAKEDMRRDSTEISTTDTAGKIIYVATVEAKQTVDDHALQMSEHCEQVCMAAEAISAENVIQERKHSSEHKTIAHDLAIVNIDKPGGSVEVIEISQNHDSQISQQSVSVEETKIKSSCIEEIALETSQHTMEANSAKEEIRISCQTAEEETRISSQTAKEKQLKIEMAPLFDARRLSQDKILSPPKSRKTSTEVDSIVDTTLDTIVDTIYEKHETNQQTQAYTQETTQVRLETVSKIDTIQQSQTTESMRETLKPLFDARRLSQDASSPQNLKGPAEETVRTDLQSQLSPCSTDSWKSWVPVPETPLTDEYVFRLQIPLDESKNPLPPSPPTEHDDPYTVKKPKLIPHIDTSIESKLFEDSKAQESNAIEEIATNSGTNGNAFPGIIDKISDKAAKPATEFKNPGTGEFDNALSSIKANTSNASNAVSKTLTIESSSTETTRRKSAVPVAESLVQTRDERRKSSANIEYCQEDMVKQNCGIIVKNEGTVTHHGGLIKKHAVEKVQKDVIANGDQNTLQTEKYNCGIVAKKDGMVTHYGGLVILNADSDVSKTAQNSTKNISTNVSSAATNLQLTQNNVNVQQTSVSTEYSKKSESNIVKTSENIAAVVSNVQNAGLEKYNCGIITKSDGVVTLHGGLIQQNADANTYHTKVEEIPPPAHLLRPSEIGSVTGVVKETDVEKYNCGVVLAEEGSVTHHGGLVSRVAVRKSGEVAQVVKRVSSENSRGNADGGLSRDFGFAEGTTQGIVDALDNAGILNEELARELGKPGLTEEKIAELISGEAEMLKEAHVIGLKRVLASHMSRLNEDEDSVDFKKIKPQLDSLRNSEVLRALNDELTQTKEEKKKEERKWTTFLQRPSRAVPRNKFDKEEPRIVEPYKIKIVKQPKPKVAPDYKPEDFETGPLPWEARAANEPPPPPAEREEPVLVPEEGPEYLEALDNLPESEVPDLEDTGLPLPPVPIEPSPFEAPVSPPLTLAELVQEHIQETLETEEEEEMVQQGESMERNQLADKILDSIQSMVDPNASMEEQLVQMRAQLAALAQLPGVISQTLEMVTGQLGHLTEKKEAKEAEVDIANVQEEVATEETSDVVNEEITEPATEVDPDTAAPQEQVAQEPAAPATPAPSPVDRQVENGAEELVLDEQMTIERNKKLMSELQLEHEQRQIKQRPTPRVAPAFGPLVPQERPLVLPGGRRWRTAKDAFNEEFIKETLTAQAEIITGKAKGINFLKWEKPVKTLDHLKDSSVYKLVHNMDAETGKRVENLPPVAMAESEYREKSSRIREILKQSGLPIQAEPEGSVSNRPSGCVTKFHENSAAERPKVCAAKCPQVCDIECPKVCTNACLKTNNPENLPKICGEESRQICVRQNSQVCADQCVTVSATNGPQVCAEVCAPLTKCPQICGGVLPEVCKMNAKGTDLKESNFGTSNQANEGTNKQANLGNKQANLGTNKQANTQAAVLDIPRATELVVPPTSPRVEVPPRPGSISEAVEIVTNYVETFSLKESRLTPACY